MTLLLAAENIFNAKSRWRQVTDITPSRSMLKLHAVICLGILYYITIA